MPKLSFRKCFRKLWKRIRRRRPNMRNEGILPGMSGLPEDVRDSADTGEGKGTMGEFVKCGKVYILKEDFEKRKQKREERKRNRLPWNDYRSERSLYDGLIRRQALRGDIYSGMEGGYGIQMTALQRDSIQRNREAMRRAQQSVSSALSGGRVSGNNALAGNEEESIRPEIVVTPPTPRPVVRELRGSMIRESLLERFGSHNFDMDYSDRGEDNA